MNELKRIGRRIEAARTNSGMTQEDLAHKADLTRAFIPRIENGLSPKLSVDSILKISKALGVPSYILIDDEIELIVNIDATLKAYVLQDPPPVHP